MPATFRVQALTALTLFPIGFLVFISLGVYATEQNSVGKHYTATVGVCHGGRYNSCDIVVHTAARDVAASANLGDVHTGQTIRVIANGSPPWGHVTQLNNPWALPDIIGIFALAGLFALGAIGVLRNVRRSFGLRSLFEQTSPSTQAQRRTPEPAASQGHPSDVPDGRPRRCIRSGCPAYLTPVTTMTCASCGSPTQHIAT